MKKYEQRDHDFEHIINSLQNTSLPTSDITMKDINDTEIEEEKKNENNMDLRNALDDMTNKSVDGDKKQNKRKRGRGRGNWRGKRGRGRGRGRRDRSTTEKGKGEGLDCDKLMSKYCELIDKQNKAHLNQVSDSSNVQKDDDTIMTDD